MTSMSNRELRKIWKQQAVALKISTGVAADEASGAGASHPIKDKKSVDTSKKHRREAEKGKGTIVVDALNVVDLVHEKVMPQDVEVESIDQTISTGMGDDWDPVDRGTKAGQAKSFWDSKFNHSAHIRSTDFLEEDMACLEKLKVFSVVKGIQSLTDRLSVLSIVNEGRVREMARKIKHQAKELSQLEETHRKGMADLKWVTSKRDNLLEKGRAFEEEKNKLQEVEKRLLTEIDALKMAREKAFKLAQIFEAETESLKGELAQS